MLCWNMNISTYSIFGSVEFFGEVIAITNQELSSPNIDDGPKRQILIKIVIYVYSTSL